MFIYWQVPSHFQLAELRFAGGDGNFHGFIATGQCPKELKAHYNLCNRHAPIGIKVRGDSDIS
eukprot:12426409-Karenia_brevis.AAC.1